MFQFQDSLSFITLTERDSKKLKSLVTIFQYIKITMIKMAYSGGSEDHQLKLQFNKAEIHLESTGLASALFDKSLQLLCG